MSTQVDKAMATDVGSADDYLAAAKAIADALSKAGEEERLAYANQVGDWCSLVGDAVGATEAQIGEALALIGAA